MGLNILIYDTSDRESPEWSRLREVNDNAFADMIDWFQITFGPRGFQPTNIEELRSMVEATDWKNKHRYLQLLDYVEQGWWLYFSR